jgi:hypothetical protein
VAATALLQLQLLEAYLALPDTSAFAAEHESLSRLCARAFKSASGQAGSGGRPQADTCHPLMRFRQQSLTRSVDAETKVTRHVRAVQASQSPWLRVHCGRS